MGEDAAGPSIDWAELWSTATRRYALGLSSLHGPDHWQRVERNGLEIESASGANVIVVRLFAVLHDSCRVNEAHDPRHGERAAAFARELQGVRFHLDGQALDTLCEACVWHDKGRVSGDATVGACWDADRLDLPRVGITPLPRFMSTARGKQIAGERSSKG